MFRPKPQDPLEIQREMNANNFLKFYCKSGIDFQLALGVLLSVESFQRRPPIDEILVQYYLNCKVYPDLNF